MAVGVRDASNSEQTVPRVLTVALLLLLALLLLALLLGAATRVAAASVRGSRLRTAERVALAPRVV